METISAPVGRNSPNHPADVGAVQRLLKRAAAVYARPDVDPGPVDEDYGDGTDAGIDSFQNFWTRRPDGVVDPGGRTIRRLRAASDIGDVDAVFPLTFSPAANFRTGMRAFSARRGGGSRAHAGADLYGPVETPVFAVAPGVVTRVAAFYGKTDAVEVDHGAFIVRYGEVYPDVSVGDRVERGQAIGTGKVGRIGRLILRGKPFKYSMCHFEMYDKTGPEGWGLTQKSRSRSAIHVPTSRPFYRRSDLIDPTPLLSAWPLPR